MKQSQFLYLGLLDLLIDAGLVVLFGPTVLVTSPIALMGIAGFGAILAGTVCALSLGPITISWRHLVGLSYVTFAFMWPAIYAPETVAGTASGRDLFLFVVTTVGALSLAFLRVDITRGGHHFSVQQNVKRVIGV